MLKGKFVAHVLLSVFLIMVTVLSGCANKDSTKGTKESAVPASPIATAAVETAKPLEPVVLTYYYPGVVQKDVQEVNDAMNVILKKKINATIKLVTIDFGNYDQKMNVLNAAGESYDLAFTANWINNYYQNVSKGNFIAIDDLLSKYAPKLKASIPDSVWQASKINGKTYGAINLQIYAMPYGYVVRKDLLDKYKFDINSVNKAEDLEPLMKQIKEKEQGITPLAVDAIYSWLPLMFGYEGIGDTKLPGVVKLENPDYKVINQYESPEFTNYVKLMKKWNDAGYFNKDAISVKDIRPDFKAGKYAIFLGQGVKPGVEAENKAFYGQDLVSKTTTKAYVTTGGIVATMTGVSKTSKNPERAMMYLELINTDKELYNLISHGIEGKHYKVVDKEKGVIGTPDGMDPKQIGYNPSTDWMFGNQFNSYYLDAASVGNWEKTAKLNATGIVSPILGFNFDAAPINTESAQVNAVIGEMASALITGTIDPDKYLPIFHEKLKKAGVDKIIAEKQKQLDAWKKTK